MSPCPKRAESLMNPPAPMGAAPDAAGLLTAAARCWRYARDGGRPVQQALHRMLAPHRCEMLAPVFDSYLTLCEAALGRCIDVGECARSDDECLLLGLLDGSMRRRACIDCNKGAASALDCAICSTRIMLAMTLGAPRGYGLQ
ncbi:MULTISPECIES: hypothetical protein [unclassified Sphingomonas]|uniref:hypothetical protein n=2 Tax=Sphingomonas TaxID=13687 RepID=UPI00285E7427|nr:hypothetical protein [Sphingomonas sp. SORGH_AS_0870]MDR6145790.1 hypothetical protein [Sphingomonas sp. SORGH_AS_0870]